MTARVDPVDAPPISPERIAAFRLARHHLAKRAPASAVSRVAGNVCGVQAQILSAAQMSLAARTRGLRPEDVEDALWRERTLAKIWCMRGTVHLVPSDDLAVFARGSTGRLDRDAHWLETHGLPAKPMDAAVDALRRALDRPRTRKDLAERVAKTLGVSSHMKSGRGWGAPRNAPGIMLGKQSMPLGYLVYRACYRGLACAGPPVNGNEATFVRPDAWLPRWRDLPMEAAETELLRRYLRAYGPATANDFYMWAGTTLTRARAIWSRLVADLAAVNVEGETAWVLRDDLTALKKANVDGPVVRLLPYFDTYLMGHKDRAHLIDAAHYKKVFRPAGWIAPVVLVDGRVGGVWSHERKGRRVNVRVDGFRPFSKTIQSHIREEADDLARFLDVPDIAVTFA